MATEERILRLENAFATLSELAARSEARIDEVVTLVRSMDERMDDHLSWINQLGEAQVNADAKIATLVDAQIKTEESLFKLTEAQANSDTKIAALTDAQLRTEEVMRNLEEVMRTQAVRTDAAIAQLAESQAHTDRRLDALIDIVKEGRGSNSQE